MAKAETTTSAARAPRGTKPVSRAFFTALESVPEASRLAVAKAAQVMIRDELKSRREKIKTAAAKEKTRKPTATKRVSKAAAPESNEPSATPAPAKRRSRKQADVPVAA